MSYREDLAAIAATHADIAAALGEVALLDTAFRRLEAIGFSLSDMDITAQDEFSLDICFPVPSTSAYLALGVT